MNPPTSQSPPSASAETKNIQRWLRDQCLRDGDFAASAVRVVAVKFRGSGAPELAKFMAAIRTKARGSECSYIFIKERSKRVEVTAVSFDK